ncbi:hypothetical protein ACIBHY_08845 [Nonomuraea sp. NPDC050547]|uniref:hypothetical protein n=1 Tax=unclassified Nonomuraea TaxID=2593643 RepID=UPI00379DF606
MFLRSPHLPSSRPTGLLIGIGFFVVIAACALVALLVPHAQVEIRFAVVGLIAALYAGLTADLIASAATGALAWTMATGFLIDPAGELVVSGGMDAIRLAAIVGLCVASGLYGAFRQRHTPT